MKEGEELYNVIGKLYDENRDLQSVSPAWLATQGMHAIGFSRALHGLGYIGCHLQLRQIARGFCRKSFDPLEPQPSNDLFPETLQDRYPARPQDDEEPQYILREHLTDDDIDFNIGRMRRMSFCLQKHSDALEAYKRDRAHTINPAVNGGKHA